MILFIKIRGTEETIEVCPRDVREAVFGLLMLHKAGARVVRWSERSDA